MGRIKEKTAITLIALVITIIVLLILAGITMAQLSNSGLFGKAQEAKEKHEIAQKKENTSIGEYDDAIEEYIDGYRAFDINSLELDYDHKVDIKGYNSSTNVYNVPSTGIFVFSATGRQASTNSYFYINGIQFKACGDGNSSGYDANAYSQFVTKGTQIYFAMTGTDGLDNAFFIPFK